MKIEWEIEEMERRAEDGFVVAVHWKLTASNNSTYAVDRGIVRFGKEEKMIFPFSDLTVQIVLDWVWSQLNKNQAEKNIADLLSEKIAPPVIAGTPW